jgi:hypothetical protein
MDDPNGGRMLIECLIKSDGPTSMTVGSFTYLFQFNEHGHKVCAVNSREARDRMLSLADFRPYEPPTEPTATAPKRKRNANRTATH